MLPVEPAAQQLTVAIAWQGLANLSGHRCCRSRRHVARGRVLLLRGSDTRHAVPGGAPTAGDGQPRRTGSVLPPHPARPGRASRLPCWQGVRLRPVEQTHGRHGAPAVRVIGSSESSGEGRERTCKPCRNSPCRRARPGGVGSPHQVPARMGNLAAVRVTRVALCGVCCSPVTQPAVCGGTLHDMTARRGRSAQRVWARAGSSPSDVRMRGLPAQPHPKHSTLSWTVQQVSNTNNPEQQ